MPLIIKPSSTEIRLLISNSRCNLKNTNLSSRGETLNHCQRFNRYTHHRIMPVNNPIYMVCSQSWPNNPDCEIHGTKPALLAGSKHSCRLQGQSHYIRLLFLESKTSIRFKITDRLQKGFCNRATTTSTTLAPDPAP